MLRINKVVSGGLNWTGLTLNSLADLMTMMT
jgi:hypothetical protein